MEEIRPRVWPVLARDSLTDFDAFQEVAAEERLSGDLDLDDPSTWVFPSSGGSDEDEWGTDEGTASEWGGGEASSSCIATSKMSDKCEEGSEEDLCETWTAADCVDPVDLRHPEAWVFPNTTDSDDDSWGSSA